MLSAGASVLGLTAGAGLRDRELLLQTQAILSVRRLAGKSGSHDLLVKTGKQIA